jgi:hypothetical protein
MFANTPSDVEGRTVLGVDVATVEESEEEDDEEEEEEEEERQEECSPDSDVTATRVYADVKDFEVADEEKYEASKVKGSRSR